MASPSSLCVCACVCAHAGLCLCRSQLMTTVPAHCNGNKLFPLSLRRQAGYIPPLPRNIGRNAPPEVTSGKIAGKDRRRGEKRVKKKQKWCGGWVLVKGFRCVKPKIRQEMRKENEKKCAPQL